MAPAQPPAADDFAVLAPRYSGAVSVMASSTVIYLTFKSRTKLRTVYHRIMLGMSTVDILSSLAMGLTTLALPRVPGDDRKPDYFDEWSGTRLGNKYTCNAQGFFFLFGINAMYIYTVSLVMYYTLAIAFKVKEEKIVKYAEPFLHAVPLILALVLSIGPLVTGNIRANGWAAPWCTVLDDFDNFSYYEVLIIVIAFLLIFVFLCFVSIIWTVARIELVLQRALRQRDLRFQTDYYERHPQMQRVGNLRSASAQQNSIKSMQNTRVIFIQALAYFLSFLITLSMPVAREIFPVVTPEDFEVDVLLKMELILMPLQGFFNALIFICHKIYNYRRIHPEVSRWRTLRLVFSGKADDHVLFSRISMVSVNGESIDINIHNERNEDNHVHIPMNVQEEDLDGYDKEAFLDEDEESLRDLSGFSSLPSTGTGTGLSLNKIDEDSYGTSTNDLSGANGEGRIAPKPPASSKGSIDLSGANLPSIGEAEDELVSYDNTSSNGTGANRSDGAAEPRFFKRYFTSKTI